MPSPPSEPDHHTAPSSTPIYIKSATSAAIAQRAAPQRRGGGGGGVGIAATAAVTAALPCAMPLGNHGSNARVLWPVEGVAEASSAANAMPLGNHGSAAALGTGTETAEAGAAAQMTAVCSTPTISWGATFASASTVS